MINVFQLQQSQILATRCDTAKSKQDHRSPRICSPSPVFRSIKFQGTSRPKRWKPAEFLSWTVESHSQPNLWNKINTKKQGFSSQIDSKTLQKQTNKQTNKQSKTNKNNAKQKKRIQKSCDVTQSPHFLCFLQPRHTFKLAQYTSTGHYALGHHETALGFVPGVEIF